MSALDRIASGGRRSNRVAAAGRGRYRALHHRRRRSTSAAVRHVVHSVFESAPNVGVTAFDVRAAGDTRTGGHGISRDREFRRRRPERAPDDHPRRQRQSSTGTCRCMPAKRCARWCRSAEAATPGCASTSTRRTTRSPWTMTRLRGLSTRHRSRSPWSASRPAGSGRCSPGDPDVRATFIDPSKYELPPEPGSNRGIDVRGFDRVRSMGAGSPAAPARYLRRAARGSVADAPRLEHAAGVGRKRRKASTVGDGGHPSCRPGCGSSHVQDREGAPVRSRADAGRTCPPRAHRSSTSQDTRGAALRRPDISVPPSRTWRRRRASRC